jgi:hypothetical protein
LCRAYPRYIRGISEVSPILLCPNPYNFSSLDLHVTIRVYIPLLMVDQRGTRRN